MVLISPRRYGKSSLANKVVHELGLPFAVVDLLTAYKEIARTHALTTPTSTEFLNVVGLSSGSVVPALKILKAKDMIIINDVGHLVLIDPLMQYLLR